MINFVDSTVRFHDSLRRSYLQIIKTSLNVLNYDRRKHDVLNRPLNMKTDSSGWITYSFPIILFFWMKSSSWIDRESSSLNLVFFLAVGLTENLVPNNGNRFSRRDFPFYDTGRMHFLYIFFIFVCGIINHSWLFWIKTATMVFLLGAVLSENS